MLSRAIIYGGRVLNRGAEGDDVILMNPQNFLPFLARAISYSDVLALHRVTMFEIIEPYPGSMGTIRPRNAPDD